MMTEQDDTPLEWQISWVEHEMLVAKDLHDAHTVRRAKAVLASLSRLAAANERIARLEGALETAARFHGIDIDVLCEQRVAAALEYPTPERAPAGKP